ncbi:hypothetical protein B0T16DRAFT_463492 [Cercophora newfieldiana]|uniref:Uncharacterized protein n=1 Tax=Cercophora newfieldiana TaxID=92897 RepID=A0AA39XTB4_9PEZI|nr:hypothetical protein B0T16DRAFT_463492 [Cercophora newfieldiana]
MKLSLTKMMNGVRRAALRLENFVLPDHESHSSSCEKCIEIIRNSTIKDLRSDGAPQEAIDFAVDELVSLFKEGYSFQSFFTLHTAMRPLREAGLEPSLMIIGLNLDMVIVRMDSTGSVLKGNPREVLPPDAFHCLQELVKKLHQELWIDLPKTNYFLYVGGRRWA